MPEANASEYSDTSLITISRDGEVPECRMRDAFHCQQFIQRLAFNDQKRSRKRSLVAGLVGGNPPYRMSKMRDANRAQDANCNWGTAFSYAESGSGSFYDLFSEAPGLVGILTSHGRDDKEKEHFSRIMSAEADNTLRNDPMLDYHMQQSQWEMTLFGCGPLFFEDKFKILPRSAHCGDLKVPERTKSDVSHFEVASLDVDYYPPELYEFIRCEGAATAAGWNVDFTQRSISNAMDIRMADNRQYDWEFYQQELKNSSLSYYDDTKIIRVAIVWWKEFDGTITQAMIERDDTTTGTTEYLFLDVGRYKNWLEALHPMYFDRGNGGFHHSVTGLGVRCYGPMEHENRLLCNLFDKAYAPDIIFRATSTEATQKFALAHMSQYALLPAGFDVAQTPVKGYVQDGLTMFKTSSELMRSNLSSYRQQVPMQKSGNPATKFEKQLEAAQMSSLSKTTFNRYYKQLDLLYAEIVRRMCNLNSTDERATKYQERCMDRGVPRECFGRIENVKAVRVLGEGSAFLRREAVTSVGQIVGSLPEDGRQRWTDDFIAAHAGQNAVTRYNPPETDKKMPDEQDERAANQVADMKVGMHAVIVSSQNALRFAGIFLSAAVQALQSVKQGANPEEVVKFLDLCVPAVMAHLKRIENDPIRMQAAEQMGKQVQQLAKMVDQLKKMIQKKQQEQKEQQQKTQQAMSDEAIKKRESDTKLQIASAKAKQSMAIKAAQTRQQLGIADATAASEIHRKNRLSSLQE